MGCILKTLVLWILKKLLKTDFTLFFRREILSYFYSDALIESDFTLKKGFFVKIWTVLANIQQNLTDSVPLRLSCIHANQFINHSKERGTYIWVRFPSCSKTSFPFMYESKMLPLIPSILFVIIFPF